MLQPSEKLKSLIPHDISNQLIVNRNGPLSEPMSQPIAPARWYVVLILNNITGIGILVIVFSTKFFVVSSVVWFKQKSHPNLLFAIQVSQELAEQYVQIMLHMLRFLWALAYYIWSVDVYCNSYEPNSISLLRKEHMNYYRNKYVLPFISSVVHLTIKA